MISHAEGAWHQESRPKQAGRVVKFPGGEERQQGPLGLTTHHLL